MPSAARPDHACCLRPAFTRQLAGKVADGGAINLISPHGQGRRRTLADLHRLLPPSTAILQGNLRNHPNSAQALLADLGRQISPDTNDLGTLLTQLTQTKRKWLLILHNFDELRKTKESGYNALFFTHLNSIVNSPAIALLIVSEEPAEEISPAIAPLHLPSLRHEDLAAEIHRRAPDLDAIQRNNLAGLLLQHPAPYTMLTEHFGIEPENP